MFLTRWLTRNQQPSRTQAKTGSQFKPLLEPLGDRLTPHASPFWSNFSPFGGDFGLLSSSSNTSTTDTPQVATEFVVHTTRSTFAGQETRVSVVALDENGRAVRDFTGTVSLSSSDAAAVLPESYTFTAEDRGRHTFVVQLPTTGEQTITATEASSTITGETTINVTDAPVASRLFVQVERNVYTGVATRVRVAVLDASNRLVPTYTGTISLTSSDTGATLPGNYTFTASDRGVKVLNLTPSTTGELTVTATDTADSGITGSVTTTVSEAPTVAKIVVRAIPVAVTGNATLYTVAAVDANNRIVPNYTGTVSFTSTDSAAVLPATTTFTASDRGVKTFAVTFNTTGTQSVTVTDAADSTLTASSDVTVSDTLSLPRPGRGFFGGRRFGWRG